ncbi:tRNA-specific adenosine deaminase 2 [Nematocida ausubeli]|nr:tRNA-specific adenosine deaminase 2 [Nematocida ausubeli]
MEVALEEAKKALSMQEVPIGCAVYSGGMLIDKAHNLTNYLRDPLAHAEMLCLERLSDEVLMKSELFITCEPCLMCLAALIKKKVARIVYSCKNPRFGGTSLYVSSGVLIETESPTEYLIRNENRKIKIEYCDDSERSIGILKEFYEGTNERVLIKGGIKKRKK